MKYVEHSSGSLLHQWSMLFFYLFSESQKRLLRNFGSQVFEFIIFLSIITNVRKPRNVRKISENKIIYFTIKKQILSLKFKFNLKF